jgi:acyl transferase domain-containing protein/phosphopantetheinyl transferase (holo-ACP synthase)
MDCVFPGAADLHAFWENIITKKDCVADAPDDWDGDRYYDPDSTANDRIYTKKGGFLRELAIFDPLKHGVMPSSIDGGEPDQFLALEVAQRALVDADYFIRPIQGDRVEVILGRGTYINRGFTTVVQHGIVVDRVLDVLRTLHPEHSETDLAQIKQELKASLPPFNAQMAPALIPNLVTGRIANRLDFQGVNYIIDAACASSHIAVQRAVEDLRAGRCDVAISGGIQASTPAPIFMIFCQLSALSRRGQIRPFDQDADGTVLAEGCGILVLKRLSDAEAAGDRIYALIKSVGTASDGRAMGMLAPRIEGEILALRRAYEECGVDPRSVELVEAHGTATKAGDAAEVASLKAVFGGPEGSVPTCALGSVKSSIGHCLPAAGSAGLIKAALALHTKILPPTINCENPNPDLGLETSSLYINTEARPWIHAAATPRRAGVNAFGFGGINSHAVLEEYRPRCGGVEPFAIRRASEVLIVAGESREVIAARARGLAEEIARGGDRPLGAHAAVLNGGVVEGSLRLAVVATSHEDAVAKLGEVANRVADANRRTVRDRRGLYFNADPQGADSKLAFLFPGEGSQYPNMLRDLAMHFPQVREWFDRIDRAFIGHRRGFRPSQMIFPPPGPQGDKGGGKAGMETLWRMDVGPEAIFAANQAAFAFLGRIGIRPDAIVGHSTGEYSALIAAGAQEFDEDRIGDEILALNSYYESLNAAGGIAKGLLIALAGVSREALAALLAERDDLFLAMDNCPHQQVVCALSLQTAAWLEERLTGMNALSARLPFDRAYHTPAFQSFCDGLHPFFDRLTIRAPHTTLYSCLSAAPMPADPAEIRRLAINQWAGRVRFRETIERVYADGIAIFVECGPRNNLCAFVDDTLKGRPHLAVPLDVEHRDGITQANHLIAQLAVEGVAMNLTDYYPGWNAEPGDKVAGKPRGPITLKTGLQGLKLASRAVQRVVKSEPEVSAPPSAPAPAPGEDVMGAYFRTMETFLHGQQELMEAFLSGEPAEEGADAAHRLAASPERFPLLHGAAVREDGDTLTAEITIDVHDSVYLEDHTIGRNISTTDPGLMPLAVVPLTFSMELLAEAAVLASGRLVVGMREVRGQRWIGLDEGWIELEVLVRRTAPCGADETHVMVRPAAQAGRLQPVFIEGFMILGEELPDAPIATPWSYQQDRRSRWAPAQIYQEIMFHGPRLQAIQSMDLWAADGSQGTLVGMPHDRLFSWTAQPRFFTDAISLDAAGQLIGMWTSDHLERGFHVFPFRMERLDIFGANLAPGETALCRAKIAMVGDSEVRSDIEIVGAEGRLRCRIQGWWDKRFDLPDRFFRLRRAPARNFLARNIEGSFGPGLVAKVVDDLSLDFLESSGQIWMRVLARLALTEAEGAYWRGMGAVTKRRAEWLLGRVAAKDAVRELLREGGIGEVCAADIDIVSEESGRPVVSDRWLEGWGLPPHISIAHKDGRAVAFAGSSALYAGVGIDIETIADRPDNFIAAAFTPHEQALIARAPVEHRAVVLTQIWCAKEAVGKAIDRGLADILNLLETETCDDDGRLWIAAAPALREQVDGLANFEVVTIREGGTLIALAAIPCLSQPLRPRNSTRSWKDSACPTRDHPTAIFRKSSIP